MKNGRVITIFVRLKKIKKQVNKNQENAFYGHFWIDTKKSYFIHFFKPGKNILSLLKQNIQIPSPLSTDWYPLGPLIEKALQGPFMVQTDQFFLHKSLDNRQT